MSKTCTSPDCKYRGLNQPNANFHKNSRKLDGLYHACKSCVSNKSSAAYKAKLDEKSKGETCIPCAGSELVKQSLDHELAKLNEENIKAIKSESRKFFIGKSNWFVPVYKAECLLAVEKLKALLQAQV